MKISTEKITELAEKRYGTNPHSFGGQRDGFKEGFKQAQQLFLCSVSNQRELLTQFAVFMANNIERGKTPASLVNDFYATLGQ